MLKTYLEVLIAKLRMRTRTLLDESGQDLIEYALVVALVAFAATAGMSTLATGINLAFSNIASVLNATIT
jgi:pilus assembly protein Flp/PilA